MAQELPSASIVRLLMRELQDHNSQDIDREFVIRAC